MQPKNKEGLVEDLKGKIDVPLQAATLEHKKKRTKRMLSRYAPVSTDVCGVPASVAFSESISGFMQPRERMTLKEAEKRKAGRAAERKDAGV